MKFKLQKKTEPSHSKQKLCQPWWGSLFKSCDHIQIPLYQRAPWCHLWPNNVKRHSFFGRCQTATSSSGHVGRVTLLWTSHWAEQRASLKKKQTWIEKTAVVCFFCLFFSSIWNFSCILLELATWDADSSARYSRRTGESSARSSLALCYGPQGLQHKPSVASAAKGFRICCNLTTQRLRSAMPSKYEARYFVIVIEQSTWLLALNYNFQEELMWM